MYIAGVDEAGRGPALGPMVIAVAVVRQEDEELLHKIGVKDSKLLTEKQRNTCFKKLKKTLAEFSTVHISAKEIDSLRSYKSLNEIEAMRIGYLLNNLKKRADIVYIDCPDNVPTNFVSRIRKYISYSPLLRVEHKADLNYAIVGAASIIAKIERDEALKRIEKEHGIKIGSGYPHDEQTLEFIENYIEKEGKLPEFARCSWVTSQNILNKKLQKKLNEF